MDGLRPYKKIEKRYDIYEYKVRKNNRKKQP